MSTSLSDAEKAAVAGGTAMKLFGLTLTKEELSCASELPGLEEGRVFADRIKAAVTTRRMEPLAGKGEGRDGARRRQSGRSRSRSDIVLTIVSDDAAVKEVYSGSERPALCATSLASSSSR